MTKILDFGKIPLAGEFIKKERLGKEKLYPFSLYYCKDCTLVQVLEDVPPDAIFKNNLYFSSTTKTLSDHFAWYAKEIARKFLPRKNGFAVEIGSNDGALLSPLKKLGARVLGVEPARVIAKVAKRRGIPTVVDFFGVRSARRILQKHGSADAIMANNVFAHLEDLGDCLRGIKILLKDNGVFVFEVHHVLHLVKDMQYDQIYHEHRCYYSLRSLIHLLRRYGFEVFDVKRIPIHGGSLRVYAQKIKGGKRSRHGSAILSVLNLEKRNGLYSLPAYIRFGKMVKENNRRLKTLLEKLKSRRKKIIGYGAPGKATVLVNVCKIGPQLLDYITDASSSKQGRYVPGMHILIVPPDRIKKDRPDYAVLFAWNFKDEILRKEKDFIKHGGKFILPVPHPQIIS